MTDQELLQAIRAITREEIQESEKRMKGEIQESEKRIKKDVIVLMDAEFGPKFNLLAENQEIIIERLDALEKKVDALEDKVLEHDFKLRIIK